MTKHNGFTLIELMIVIAILSIVGSMILGAVTGSASNNLSFGYNGITETRCINGYQFVVGRDGNARQVLDEFGKGARCQ